MKGTRTNRSTRERARLLLFPLFFLHFSHPLASSPQRTLHKTIPTPTSGARVPRAGRRRLQAHRPGARQAGARRGRAGRADAPRLHQGRAVAPRGRGEEDRFRRGGLPGQVRRAAAGGNQGEHGGGGRRGGSWRWWCWRGGCLKASSGSMRGKKREEIEQEKKTKIKNCKNNKLQKKERCPPMSFVFLSRFASYNCMGKGKGRGVAHALEKIKI